MILTDDHKTWVSTIAVVAPRLDLRPDPSARTILDGAWWPRSRDTITELTSLVTALDARHLQVTRVMLNPDAWDGWPRRVSISGRTVRLGWFSTLNSDLLIATIDSNQRLDLLVVPPDTSAAAAQAAMETASGGDPTLRAEAILAAASPRAAPLTPAQSSAEDVWESEGGQINGHLTGRPS